MNTNFHFTDTNLNCMCFRKIIFTEICRFVFAFKHLCIFILLYTYISVLCTFATD